MKPKRSMIEGKCTPYTTWLHDQEPESLNRIELEDFIFEKERMIKRWQEMISRQDQLVKTAKEKLEKHRIRIL